MTKTEQNNVYVTVSGDVWDMIAFKIYGDCNRLVDLMNANSDLIETVVFSAGINIMVPEIEVDTGGSNLPPWKK